MELENRSSKKKSLGPAQKALKKVHCNSRLGISVNSA
jgi:hypothetical protein